MRLDPNNWLYGGMTRIGVIAVIAMVILLLVVLILPQLAVAKRRSSRVSCVNNIRQIELAFKTWAADNEGKMPMALSVTNGGSRESALRGEAFTTFQLMSNEISAPKLLICFEDLARKPVPNFSELRGENVSYFVGLDANDTYTNSILTGDRNLSLNGEAVRPGLVLITTNNLAGWTEEMHGGKGNLGMGDGSVRQVQMDGLRKTLGLTGFGTNRLVVP